MFGYYSIFNLRFWSKQLSFTICFCLVEFWLEISSPLHNLIRPRLIHKFPQFIFALLENSILRGTRRNGWHVQIYHKGKASKPYYRKPPQNSHVCNSFPTMTHSLITSFILFYQNPFIFICIPHIFPCSFYSISFWTLGSS